MENRGGFTRTDLVIVVGVVALALVFVQLIPSGHVHPNHITCLNNLRQIGGMLLSQPDQEKLRRLPGAAYLLQIADQIKDDQLKVFLCPGDTGVPGRPERGSPEFVAAYRAVTDWSTLDEETLARLCSYAGPNWRDHPYEPAPGERRILAADACRGGRPHHEKGICVLFDDGTVKFLKFADMEDVDGERFTVGPDSPDPRFRSLCFLPRQ